MMGYIIIYWTSPNIEEARRVATLLLKEKLVACAHIIPQIESLFIWKDKLEASSETQVLLKSRVDKFEEIKEKIVKNTTYEVPEILMVPLLGGHGPYLDWLDSCLS